MSFFIFGFVVPVLSYSIGVGLGYFWGAQKLPRVIVKWEPIEHDGYAGEPQGREHGA